MPLRVSAESLDEGEECLKILSDLRKPAGGVALEPSSLTAVISVKAGVLFDSESCSIHACFRHQSKMDPRFRGDDGGVASMGWRTIFQILRDLRLLLKQGEGH